MTSKLNLMSKISESHCCCVGYNVIMIHRIFISLKVMFLRLSSQTNNVLQHPVLLPLMFLQITTLINHKDKPKKSERTLAAIHRVGQAVSVAVGRFVAVGEAIATENQELKDEMGQACFEARRAGRLLLCTRHFTELLHLNLTHCEVLLFSRRQE